MRSTNGNQLLEEEKYILLKPYNLTKEFFNTDKFNVIITLDEETNEKVVIIRERKSKRKVLRGKKDELVLEDEK